MCQTLSRHIGYSSEQKDKVSTFLGVTSQFGETNKYIICQMTISDMRTNTAGSGLCCFGEVDEEGLSDKVTYEQRMKE